MFSRVREAKDIVVKAWRDPCGEQIDAGMEVGIEEGALRAIEVILVQVYLPEGVQLWWSNPRHQLDGATPREALERGEIEEVTRLALSALDMTAT